MKHGDLTSYEIFCHKIITSGHVGEFKVTIAEYKGEQVALLVFMDGSVYRPVAILASDEMMPQLKINRVRITAEDIPNPDFGGIPEPE